MRIRAARGTELASLQAIDRAAGRMFADIGMPEIARHHWWPLPVLEDRQDAGRLWVAAAEADEPVAFLMADLVDGCLHVEQVSVHPGSARRGVGRRLLDHAASLAAAEGLPALALTTFAHVPWTGPYYARCGFGSLTTPSSHQALRAIRQREGAAGLDRWPRVGMRRGLAGHHEAQTRH
jgi:GNAT superfamily N-acetyltransferase